MIVSVFFDSLICLKGHWEIIQKSWKLECLFQI
jgi:hypothetical protein